MNKFTKIIFVAFVLSLGIHFIMYFAINKSLHSNTLKINTTNKKTKDKKEGLVNIKYVKIKKKEEIKAQKKTEKKVIEQTKTQKNIVKKLTKTKTLKKTVSKIDLPTLEKKPIDLKQFFIIQKQDTLEKKEEDQKTIKRQKEIEEIKQLPALTQSYIKLYGEQYFEFSPTQRRYLKQNLNKIGKITQRYLEYPAVSIRTQQKGLNIVEFYFHPNGDITELKLSDSSFYTALDENTLETIRVAYQHYPRPFEKVKIKIFVRYILY